MGEGMSRKGRLAFGPMKRETTRPRVRNHRRIEFRSIRYQVLYNGWTHQYNPTVFLGMELERARPVSSADAHVPVVLF
ncbi:protein of unknown function [Candidatus Nitrospira inopinata]|uniref:Uncharacterized protein n=1 Tax=Candidatus Nitrospira inopinata TaxID=1715989 RepID=A0A0S4KY79_9BACT|nr:protein of unknown function [Candidatus Nitrospira inopinata]